MNSRQKKTLWTVWSDPVSGSIPFTDIESLLSACGCRAVEGSGSRVKWVFGDRILALHRPHPQKEAKRYQVRDVRAFLDEIGVRP